MKFTGTTYIINAGPCFCNILCKLMNMFKSPGFLPHSLLLGKIQPTMKNSAGSKTSSSYWPVMNSSNFFKMFEYLILLHLEQYLNLSHNQFAYRPSPGYLNAITLLKETISHYNQRHSDMFCAMIDLSQAYDRININTLCTKLKRTELPGQNSRRYASLPRTISYRPKVTWLSTINDVNEGISTHIFNYIGNLFR